MAEAMRIAYPGEEMQTAGHGGSIPLCNTLASLYPDAEILLLGTTDGFANIHAPNERVVLDEFEKAVAVETEFFSRLAETFARKVRS